jgi:hypothetical protein
MIIGDKESFAVEYELDQNHGGTWMYGKICYWISNYQVGDYELGTSLRDTLFAMKYLIGDCGNREGLVLCDLSPEEAFFQLNESIYGNLQKVDTNLPDTPARFDILIPVDVFSQWKIFLIDCNNFTTILYKRDTEESVRYFRIKRGEFDNIIKQLYINLESMYDRTYAKT